MVGGDVGIGRGRKCFPRARARLELTGGGGSQRYREGDLKKTNMRNWSKVRRRSLNFDS